MPLLCYASEDAGWFRLSCQVVVVVGGSKCGCVIRAPNAPCTRSEALVYIIMVRRYGANVEAIAGAGRVVYNESIDRRFRLKSQKYVSGVRARGIIG